VGATGIHVGGDAAEGDGEIVEGLEVVVGERGGVEDETDLLAGVETFGEREAVAEAELKAVGVLDAVLFAAVVRRMAFGRRWLWSSRCSG
jgi:hypothetical protein